MNILQINSSPMGENSVSKGLTTRFVEKLTERLYTAELTSRDLADTNVPLLTAATVGAFYTPVEALADDQKALISLSDELVAELEAAEVIVIGAPMHNFSVSGQLKTYIDQVARVGRTFQYTENGPQGLLKDKKVFVMVTTGGNYTSGPLASLDHLTPYLATMLGFIGITDVTFIQCPSMAANEEAKASSIAAANAQISQIIEQLTV
ncbi:MAG: FMN-dependent NADH-azoreductase [Oceanospirillaceae bacterium]|jgi:FMN-dependent NADH-azoreductase